MLYIQYMQLYVKGLWKNYVKMYLGATKKD